MCVYIYIYTNIIWLWGPGAGRLSSCEKLYILRPRDRGHKLGPAFRGSLRPVHLLRVVLLRVLESKFLGDSLSNSMDMRMPTP